MAGKETKKLDKSFTSGGHPLWLQPSRKGQTVRRIDHE